MRRAALCVFAKDPVPGRVKTRMSPPLSTEQAAALYAAMLADVLAATADQACRLGLEPRLQFDPPTAKQAFVDRLAAVVDANRNPVLPSDASSPARHSGNGFPFRLRPQRGEGLGARMANAFAEMAAEGFERMVLRGSDCPGLDLDLIAEALAALEAGADLVLTPDHDGGYALIALKKPHDGLFDLGYSTPFVLDETLARARGLALSVSLTRPTFDVDVAADLAGLEAIAPAQSSVLCPRTVEFVRALRGMDVL